MTSPDGAVLASVVIPAYDAAGTLAETLESVLAQGVRQWEALVVDDGSTDATREIAGAFARRDRRVRVLALDRNGGVAAARNRAVAEARGEVVAFLDADDVYLPPALAALASALDAGPPCGVAYAMARTMRDPAARPLGRGEARAPAGLFAQLARFNVLVTSAVAVRRRALGDAPFPTGLPFQFEDWACWLELSRRHAFRFVPAVVTAYREGAAGATARVTASGRAAAHAAAMGRYLRSAARAYAPAERSSVDAGLSFRATAALLAALHRLRRGRVAGAAAWLRAAGAIAGSPATLARAAAAVGPERRRARRGDDPPLTLLPPPSAGDAP